jgi:hypothetical protein
MELRRDPNRSEAEMTGLPILIWSKYLQAREAHIETTITSAIATTVDRRAPGLRA